MVSLRVVAAGVVILGGGYIGMLFAMRLIVRVRQIEQLQTIITQIGFNIDFLKMPVANALSMAASGHNNIVGQIFSVAAEGISKDGLSPSAALERAILSNRNSLCITHEDIEILTEFAKGIGLGDAEYEMNNVGIAKARLCLAQREAEGDCAQKVKLRKGMGLLGGMLVALILF